jgi:hypothetical protein
MTSRPHLIKLVLVGLVVSLGLVYAQGLKKPVIAFPEGYRKWVHVKTMIVFSKESKLFDRFEGMHNIYVNEAGWNAFRIGAAYPDGAMFVFDLYDVRTYQGTMEARGRKFLAVMKKNSKLYPGTGGWGFEIFQGYQGKGSLKDMKECFNCHSAQKGRDYIFSEFAE